MRFSTAGCMCSTKTRVIFNPAVVFIGVVAFAYSTGVNESVVSYLYPLFQPYKPLFIDRI